MIKMIGPFSFWEFVDRVREFHGFPAPGVVLGGIMVDLVLKNLPPDILFDALCETSKCLPDAVQLLTPCTVGNGWLTIRDWGRFALALYDKKTGTGIRVVIHPAGVEAWPEIKDWYYKLKPKKEVDPDKLLQAIQGSGPALCSLQGIQVTPALLEKKPRGNRVVCPQCQEASPATAPGLCLACRGESPYLSTIFR
ncbi:MAG TPA: formylmethanofuran dehydrogenase subunit E family protein [Thermodesulfobacteriota bacterium]|nr:formylmethanofuran dehydrogenase subunit E family protein [Thermodesulfobacteriota bacterium]